MGSEMCIRDRLYRVVLYDLHSSFVLRRCTVWFCTICARASCCAVVPCGFVRSVLEPRTALLYPRTALLYPRTARLYRVVLYDLRSSFVLRRCTVWFCTIRARASCCAVVPCSFVRSALEPRAALLYPRTAPLYGVVLYDPCSSLVLRRCTVWFRTIRAGASCCAVVPCGFVRSTLEPCTALLYRVVL